MIRWRGHLASLERTPLPLEQAAGDAACPLGEALFLYAMKFDATGA